MSSSSDVFMVPDAERIAAARWAARELLLGRLVAGAPRRWTVRIDGKGGITSSSPHARRPR